MGYKVINGVEVIERGESLISVPWLKSRTEAEAVRMRSDKNQTRAAWKEANGFSVPNYSEQGKVEKLMKLKRSDLVEKAESLDIDFESDANKETIAKLIVDKENT